MKTIFSGFLDPGSGMGKNQDPAGIRDKHPGSASLQSTQLYISSIHYHY
jgi:hypothetical protein